MKTRFFPVVAGVLTLAVDPAAAQRPLGDSRVIAPVPPQLEMERAFCR